MDQHEQMPDSIDELLAPIDRSLLDSENGSAEIGDARQAYESTADVLFDIGEEQAARIVRTLGLLLDVFAGASLSDDGDAFRKGVHEFQKDSVSTLRRCLKLEVEAPSFALSQIQEEASSRWGEHLQLLSGDHDCDYPPVNDDVGAAEENPADGSDEQVGLILTALGSGTPPEHSIPQTSSRQEDSVNQSASGPTTTHAVPSEFQSLEMDPELLEAYLEDAVQCLGSMERAILAFENDPQSRSPIEQLCRDLHTLKGASASVGLEQLASELHDVEDALEGCEPEAATGPMQMAMDCVDAVRKQIAALQSPHRGESQTDDVGNAQVSSAPVLALDDAGESDNSIRVRTTQLDRLMDLLADVVMWRSRREERVHELDGADEEISRSLFRLQAIEERSQSMTKHESQTTADLSNRVGDYVSEISGDLREVGQSLRQTRQALAEENREISQFILQFRQQLVRMKRVPLAGVFQRLHRAVRDAARAEGKEVRLEVRGGTFGLERSLQEKLYEPLLHLVRNAVSHGIETPEVRAATGKPAVGTITLEAYGSSHVLIIEVRDDGRGLDYDAIRRRGLERGLIVADRPASKAELSRLIFRPGFSTRDATSELAGRGVGMNVVEETLHRSQCHIETESESGRGTCFRLTIPQRSVIEHTLLFRCGGQSFGIPMQYVRAASQAGDRQSHQVASSPSCRLEEFLELPGNTPSDNTHWIDIADRLTGPLAQSAVGESAQEHQLRLEVAEILGPEEVVVRPLPSLLRGHPHLCGMTLSGAGDVVLLLDGRRLLSSALARSANSMKERPATPDLPSDDHADETRVLVVDDSFTARRKLVQKLQGYGFAITQAADGAEAIELLKQHTFDAVFTDLEMPNLTGFDVLTELATSPETAPPCVMITSRSGPETRAQAMALGAAGFVPKPIDEQAVDELIQQLLLTSSTSAAPKMSTGELQPAASSH